MEMGKAQGQEPGGVGSGEWEGAGRDEEWAGRSRGRALCTGTRALGHGNSFKFPPSLPGEAGRVLPPGADRTIAAAASRASWARSAGPVPALPVAPRRRLRGLGGPCSPRSALQTRRRPGSQPSRAPTRPPRHPREPGSRLGLHRPGPGSAAEVRLGRLPGRGAAPRPDCGQCRNREPLERSRVRPCNRPTAWVSVLAGPGAVLARTDPAGFRGRERRGAAARPGLSGGRPGRGPGTAPGPAGRAEGRAGLAGGAGGSESAPAGCCRRSGVGEEWVSARPRLLGRSLTSGAKYFGGVSIS